MSEQVNKGVYQLENGYWAYRYVIVLEGKRKERKKSRNEEGKPFKTEKQAARARKQAIAKEKAAAQQPQNKNTIERKTVAAVFNEYVQLGRNGKAYSTIKKQDSLWKNHISVRFGNRYIDEIAVAEIQDYLEELYYIDNRAYSYVESFLKMFYLIFGQAYCRNYLSMDIYSKLCKNKETKIHMPKMKIDEDRDIISFNSSEISTLDDYFRGTNAETAYLLGKYCGLRINECYGLKWCNIDIEKGTIKIDRQMQYQNGLIKLVSLKTRNAKRKIYMCSKLKAYFLGLQEEREKYICELHQQRQQNQTFIQDLNGSMLSSLELVNTLPNGKMQTINSMKYHSRILKSDYNINFKYHYLRHTYGTNLAELNTPTHLLCNQMGHSSNQVTQKYYIAISENGVNTLLNNLEKV